MCRTVRPYGTEGADTPDNGTQQEPDNALRVEEPVYETPEEPPNTPEEPLRRSQRTRRAPVRFGDPIME